MKKIFIRLTAGTDVGRVRTNNEDNFILNKDLSQSDWFVPETDKEPLRLGEKGCVLSVADGMGGLNAGEVASDIAITTVRDMFSSENLSKIAKSERNIEKFMTKCVLKADSNIKDRVKKDPSTSGMGTTLVILWIYGSKAHIVWCGDSRGYVFNQTYGLRRITKDHSYVQQLVDDGKLEPELAFDHPDSNIITRCLGDFKDKAKPDYNSFDLMPGDITLICSDGLCGLCRDGEILQVMRENFNNLTKCKRELIAHAMNAGGYDNCTLALCEIVSIDGNTADSSLFSNSISSTVNEFVKSVGTIKNSESGDEEYSKEDQCLPEAVVPNIDQIPENDSAESPVNDIVSPDTDVKDGTEPEHVEDSVKTKSKDWNFTMINEKSSISKSDLIVRLVVGLLIIVAVAAIAYIKWFSKN